MLGLLGRLVGLLPQTWIAGFGRVLGGLVFSVLRVRRRVTLDNVQRALGLPRDRCIRLAARVYAHLCTGALELLRVHRLTPDHAREILDGDGLHRIEGHLGRGRGLLVLTAHLGQFDLLACAAGQCGLNLNVVTRRIKAGWINRFWMAQRRRCGVRLLPAHGSAKGVLSALRRNEVVALVLDQHEPSGVPVPFFGRPAATSTTLARLARATGAPVVPAFLLRDGSNYRFVVGDEITVPKTDAKQDDLFEATRRFNEVIEDKVREHPEQWLWLHRRWKLDVRTPS